MKQFCCWSKSICCNTNWSETNCDRLIYCSWCLFCCRILQSLQPSRLHSEKSEDFYQDFQGKPWNVSQGEGHAKPKCNVFNQNIGQKLVLELETLTKSIKVDGQRSTTSTNRSLIIINKIARWNMHLQLTAKIKKLHGILMNCLKTYWS